MTAKLTAAFLLALYLGTGALCFASPSPEPTPHPWGAPAPEARWAQPVQRDDPRPFLIRLLTSIRWDFYHRDIRGGADF